MSAQPDFEKRLTHKQRLVRLLSDARWHGMKEMQAEGGYRYGARLLEMRKAGMKIETRQVFGDVFEYRWNRTPENLDLFGEKP